MTFEEYMNTRDKHFQSVFYMRMRAHGISADRADKIVQGALEEAQETWNSSPYGQISLPELARQEW